MDQVHGLVMLLPLVLGAVDGDQVLGLLLLVGVLGILSFGGGY